MSTVTVRNVDCDANGRLILRPVHYVTTAKRGLYGVAERYVRETYGANLNAIGSSQRAERLPDGSLRVILAVPRPGAPRFHAIRFEEVRAPERPATPVCCCCETAPAVLITTEATDATPKGLPYCGSCAQSTAAAMAPIEDAARVTADPRQYRRAARPAAVFLVTADDVPARSFIPFRTHVDDPPMTADDWRAMAAGADDVPRALVFGRVRREDGSLAWTLEAAPRIEDPTEVWGWACAVADAEGRAFVVWPEGADDQGTDR